MVGHHASENWASVLQRHAPLQLPAAHDALTAKDSFAAGHFNKSEIERVLDEHARRRDHSQRLYALLMLELWWRAARP